MFGHTVRDHVNRRTAEEDLQERRRRQRARRELSIKQQSDGMYKLFGLFDPIAGARIETALAAATRKLRRGEDPADRATPAQRSADALELLVTRQGGAKPQSTTLIVIANYDVIDGRLRDAGLVDGTPLAADELLKAGAGGPDRARALRHRRPTPLARSGEPRRHRGAAPRSVRPATGAASAAPPPTTGASPTTSGTGSTAAPPTSTTCACSAATAITGGCTTTAPRSRPRPTAGAHSATRTVTIRRPPAIRARPTGTTGTTPRTVAAPARVARSTSHSGSDGGAHLVLV